MIHFADHLSHHFINTALWVNKGCSASEAQTLQTKLQALFQELHQATTELDKAEQSLRYNPLGHNKRISLQRLARQMHLLRSGYANLADMIRVFAKWSESSSLAKADQRTWAEHLNSIAELVKEWKRGLDIQKADKQVPHAPALIIKAPSQMETYQYPLALYTNAEQIIQDFQDRAFSTNVL